MIRKGDVYTHSLKSSPGNIIAPCYSPFIVMGIEGKYIIAVTLTQNLNHYKEQRKLYTKMTVNGNTRAICILPDISFRIPVNQLGKKLTHISSEEYNGILSIQNSRKKSSHKRYLDSLDVSRTTIYNFKKWVEEKGASCII